MSEDKEDKIKPETRKRLMDLAMKYRMNADVLLNILFDYVPQYGLLGGKILLRPVSELVPPNLKMITLTRFMKCKKCGNEIYPPQQALYGYDEKNQEVAYCLDCSIEAETDKPIAKREIKIRELDRVIKSLTVYKKEELEKAEHLKWLGFGENFIKLFSDCRNDLIELYTRIKEGDQVFPRNRLDYEQEKRFIELSQQLEGYETIIRNFAYYYDEIARPILRKLEKELELDPTKDNTVKKNLIEKGYSMRYIRAVTERKLKKK